MRWLDIAGVIRPGEGIIAGCFSVRALPDEYP